MCGLTTKFDNYLKSRMNNEDHRRVSKSRSKIRTQDFETVTATELDSHADSPVVGRHSSILEFTGKTIKVSGFSDELGSPISVPVVHAAVAYDCDRTGETHIMIIHHALYLESMKENLIPPFLMRLAGLEVDECPKFLAKEPREENHSIRFPSSDMRIHLKLEGIISYLPTRCPSPEELEQYSGEYLQLTPNTPDWDPSNTSFQHQEESMVDFDGNLRKRRKLSDGNRWTGSTGNEVLDSYDVEAETIDKRYISAINSSAFDTISDPGWFALSLASLNQSNMRGDTVDKQRMSSIRFKGKKSIDPNQLSRKWKIPLEMAKKTIRATTQLCIRSADVPSLSRRYKANDRMLRYLRVACKTFMDTMFSAKKAGTSIRGYKAAQVFVTEFGHLFVVPMESKKGAEVAAALKRYFKEIGVPEAMICDGAREQVQGAALVLCNLAGCQIIELEKDTPASNRAERYIGQLKTETKDDLVSTDSPLCLWCYCIERRAKINNAIAKNIALLEGQVPNSMMTGQPTDISSLCEFGWYEWVKYRREGAQYPFPHERLGRALGPATHAGTMMSQWILTDTGDVLPIQTVRSLTHSEMNNPDELVKRERFTKMITAKLGHSGKGPPSSSVIDQGENERREDTQVSKHIPEADEITDYDLYLNSEVLLPQDGEHMQAARVISRSRNDAGLVIGEYNSNPILDTRVYDVMFPDSSVQQYAANIIAENLYSQVDEDGRRYQLMEAIIGHKKTDKAVERGDEWVIGKNGRKARKKTTKGWFFEVQWKDGLTSWSPLCEMKEAYPLEVAEYCQENNLLEEPAIAWWANHTIKKRNQIISKVKAKVKKRSLKYGIQVPRTVREALILDEANKNTFWRDAIAKEMKNVLIAFEIQEDTDSIPVGRSFIECYMIFDVKMDLTRKARFVANGAKTDDLKSSNWAGVVSRESVRIALTYAALHELELFAADIQNAYLQAPISERYWTRCGPEFGTELEGKVAIIVRALYGTKCAGRDFRNHLRDCMSHLGYNSCLADPDLWMRKSVNSKGQEYYEYMLLYVDDCLCVSENGRQALDEIDKYFPMKPGSIGPPSLYLGAKICKMELPNGVKAYALSTSQYVQEAVRNVEKYLLSKGMKLSNKRSTPIVSNYRPELDASTELDEIGSTYYQSLIGILRWIVEMGRVDIGCEVSMLSSHIAMPREGHLQQVFHIFSYLKSHHNARLVFDPSYPDMDFSKFEKHGWEIHYDKVKEDIPLNAPQSLGLEFIIRAYVDASHAGCKLTRRSRTGFIVMLNNSPIYWLSKKQTSVETSTFGSEFVAMKQCCEYLRGLRYKLRMMGVPVTNPCFVYGDNQSVLWNTSIPDSVIKKKSNSIAYHFVREGCARGEWRTAYVPTDRNPSDVLTKSLPAGEDRKRKVRWILYDIYPS